MTDIEQGQVFILPGTKEYDRAIASIDEDIEEKGGIRSLIEGIRFTRRYSHDYHSFLNISQKHTFNVLQDPDNPLLSDEKLAKARAMLAGMVMGNVVNEGLFPLLIFKRIYQTIGVPPSLFAPGASSKEIKREEKKQSEQQRIYQIAANIAFTRIGDGGQEYVRLWAEHAVDSHPVQFTLGFGAAIHMGYDYHERKYFGMVRTGEAIIVDQDKAPDTDP